MHYFSGNTMSDKYVKHVPMNERLLMARNISEISKGIQDVKSANVKDALVARLNAALELKTDNEVLHALGLLKYDLMLILNNQSRSKK